MSIYSKPRVHERNKMSPNAMENIGFAKIQAGIREDMSIYNKPRGHERNKMSPCAMANIAFAARGGVASQGGGFRV
jgi:hypothetical protein